MRIKDIPTTASSAAGDDYIEIDGATNGSRKILASAFAVLTNSGNTLTFTGGSSVSDTSGAIALTAAGANQNVTLTPSGTGFVTTSNGLRITGSPTFTGPTGMELSVSGGNAVIRSYDRTGAAYHSLLLDAAAYTFQIGGVTKFGFDAGGNLSATGTGTQTFSGVMAFTNATVSTSTTTGGVQISGGVGVQGATYIAGYLSSAGHANVGGGGSVVSLGGSASVAAGLPASWSGGYGIGYQYGGSPNHNLYFGDGSGYSLNFVSRTGSTNTVRMTLSDNGNLQIAFAGIAVNNGAYGESSVLTLNGSGKTDPLFINVNGTAANHFIKFNNGGGSVGSLGFDGTNMNITPTSGTLALAGSVLVGATDVVLSRAGAGSLQLSTTGTNSAFLSVLAPTNSQQAGIIFSNGTQAWDVRNDGSSLAFRNETAAHYPMSITSGAVNAASVQIALTTAASSTTTGALQVAGGVGIQGALFINGNITSSGTFIAVGSARVSSGSVTAQYTSASADAFALSNTNTGGKVWTFGDGSGTSAGRFGFYNQTGTTLAFWFDGSGNTTAVGNLTVSGVGTSSFAGVVTGTTAAGTDSSTKFATTAFVATAANSAFVTLTDAASITSTCIAAAGCQNWVVTLGGDRALATPTGLVGGMSGVLIVKQDVSGNRHLTLWSGSKVVSGGGAVITLTTTANAIDILTWVYDGTTTWWSYGKNYT